MTYKSLQRGSIVEIVGPAGAGKSSLFKALQKKEPRIICEEPPPIWNHSYVQFYLRNIGRLFPLFVHLPHREFKVFSRRILIYMIFLTGWHDLLNKKAELIKNVILLDQGPIFMMAYLSIFGQINTEYSRIYEWRKKTDYQWAHTINTIIYLDTSNEALISRNRNRQDHEIKHISGKSNAEARDFLEKYRNVYKQIINRFTMNNDQLRVVWIDTEEFSIEKAVDIVISEMSK